jgi:hypothetical protein
VKKLIGGGRRRSRISDPDIAAARRRGSLMEDGSTELIWCLASGFGALAGRAESLQREKRQHQRLGCRTNLRGGPVAMDDSFAEQVCFPRFPTKRDEGAMFPFAHFHTTNNELIRITSIPNKPSSPENRPCLVMDPRRRTVGVRSLGEGRSNSIPFKAARGPRYLAGRLLSRVPNAAFYSGIT